MLGVPSLFKFIKYKGGIKLGISFYIILIIENNHALSYIELMDLNKGSYLPEFSYAPDNEAYSTPDKDFYSFNILIA